MIQMDECTGYFWSLEANIRLLDLKTCWPDGEDGYFTKRITKEKFLENIANCTVKPNSQPRKTDKYLEYRMYGLVPYNISPIQQGIQFGHAVVDYGRSVRDLKPLETIYNKWADNDKTFIILNGGTTNNNPEKLGTLNNHFYTLQFNAITVQPFYEPDLGDQLTAFCFLVDERVFNKKLYPNFIPTTLPWTRSKPSLKMLAELDEINKTNRLAWVEKIGGEKNAFLRDYLEPLRLA
jgi:hypothetical protein